MKKKGLPLELISKYRIEIYGISILLIMLFHFSQIHCDYYGPRGATGISFVIAHFFRRYFGSVGVEIFSFMSGISMYYAFSTNNDIGRFYKRRYKRILIPYVYVATIFWAMKDLLVLDLGLTRFLKDFLFITFATRGVRTIWFILFLMIAYLIVPPVFKAGFGSKGEIRLPAALILAASTMLPFVIKNAAPTFFSNTEILTTRIPLFLLGLFFGKYVKEKREMPYAALALLTAITLVAKYYGLYGSPGAIAERYIAAIFGVFLLSVMTALLALLDNARLLRRVLSFFGKYSLELYLLHVTIRNLAATIGIQQYRISRYTMIIAASMILSPLLSKLSEATSKKLK